MSGKYTMTDLIKNGDAYLNTGVAMECPLCGEESFYLWQMPTLSFMWGVCSSCRWAGNGAHLRSRLSGVLYSVATTEYDIAHGKRNMQKVEDAPEEHREMHRRVSQSLEEKEENVDAYRTLFSEVTGNDPFTTRAMSGVIGYESHRHSLVVPHYITPKGEMMGSLHTASIRGNRPDISTYLFTHGGGPPLRYGWVDLSDNPSHIILVTNLYDAAMISSSYQAGGIVETPPVILSMGSNPPFVIEKTMNVPMTLVTNRVPEEWLSVMLRSESVRIFEGTPQQFVGNMEYSAHNCARQAWEMALSPTEWLLSMVEGREKGYCRLLKAIRDPSILMDLLKCAGEGAQATIKSISHLPLAPSYCKIHQRYYSKREEGGYNVIRAPNGYHDATLDPIGLSMDVDIHIVSDNATLQRGLWECEGKSFPGEIMSKKHNHSYRKVHKQLIDHGVENIPEVSISQDKLMSINRNVSHPKDVSGKDSAGYYLGEGLFLPGLTITDSGIEGYGRIVQYDANYLPEGEWSGGLPPASDDVTRLAFCCFVAAGIQLMDMIGQWCKQPLCIMAQNQEDCDLSFKILEDKLGVGKCNGYLSTSYSSAGGIRPTHEGKSENRQVRYQAKHNSLHIMDIPEIGRTCDVPDIPPSWYRLLWESAQGRIGKGRDGSECCCDAAFESFQSCLDRVGIDMNLGNYWPEIDCQKDR